MSFVATSIVEVFVNKITSVDDWTTERVIIASNLSSGKICHYKLAENYPFTEVMKMEAWI